MGRRTYTPEQIINKLDLTPVIGPLLKLELSV